MFKKTLLLTSSVALLSASTTMCFKKEHIDPSTIETVKLEGGECKGKLSSEDMQRNGYAVSDIKISSGETGLNYIYIFKKDEPLATVTTDGKYILSKEDLRAKMQELRAEEIAEEKEKIEAGNIAVGKTFYEANCQQCHGDGTIAAYGTARPLRSMSLSQMENAIIDYDYDQKVSSTAALMKPYANMLTTKRIQNIYSYLQSLQ